MKFQTAVGYQVFVAALHYHHKSSLRQVHIFERITFRIEYLLGDGNIAQVGIDIFGQFYSEVITRLFHRGGKSQHTRYF